MEGHQGGQGQKLLTNVEKPRELGWFSLDGLG